MRKLSVMSGVESNIRDGLRNVIKKGMGSDAAINDIEMDEKDGEYLITVEMSDDIDTKTERLIHGFYFKNIDKIDSIYIVDQDGEELFSIDG